MEPTMNHVLPGMQIQSVEVENIRKVSVIIREERIRETVDHAPATPLSASPIPVVPDQSLNPTPQPAQQPLRPLPLPNPSLRYTERISINQKHIQRQQPQLGRQLPNLIIPQIQLLHLPPNHFPVPLKLLRNIHKPI